MSKTLTKMEIVNSFLEVDLIRKGEVAEWSKVPHC